MSDEPHADRDETAVEGDVVEYDRWDWHTGGVFPKNVPPEQGFVHIAMYLTWLVLHGQVDLGWADRSGVLDDVAAIAERRETAMALRDRIDGVFASDMLTAEGRGFTDAFYLPPYGFPEVWQRTFGRRADSYGVPDGWETYGRVAPEIDRAFDRWVEAGRPASLEPPAPGGLLGLLARYRRGR
jgi:hypothetical protein